MTGQAAQDLQRRPEPDGYDRAGWQRPQPDRLSDHELRIAVNAAGHTGGLCYVGGPGTWFSAAPSARARLPPHGLGRSIPRQQRTVHPPDTGRRRRVHDHWLATLHLR